MDSMVDERKRSDKRTDVPVRRTPLAMRTLWVGCEKDFPPENGLKDDSTGQN